MTKLKVQKLIRYLAGTLCVFAVTVSATLAIGVGVKPIRTELIIDPGGSATATIRVINSERIPVTVRPEITIYTKNDEEGFPIQEDLTADHPMNIRSWIEFPRGNLSLDPNSEEQITFTVNVPEDAQPGGRYASILYVSVDDATSDGVRIQVAVPSLILIKVSGEEVHSGNALSFGTHEGKIYGDQNPTFAVSFKNSGNVHERPRGSIILTDSSGKQLTRVARYRHPVSGELVTADAIPLNMNGGNVLPGSSRTFTAEWNEGIQSGEFTAKLDLEYSSSQPTLTEAAVIDIRENLELDNFVINQREDATDFTLALTNTGSVFEKPKGKVEIINEFNNLMAAPEITLDSYIAPGETVTIDIPWLDKQVPRGKYTAKLVAAYGFSDAPLESEEIHFASDSINYVLYGMIGGGVLLVVLLTVVIMLLLSRRKRKSA